VLLDAGAGDRWVYVTGGARHARSEGLAVASYELFMRGGFSSGNSDLCTNADGLARLDTNALARAFQVTAENPLVGIEGRAKTLARLGVALTRAPDVFGPDGRPGNLLDALRARATAGRVKAAEVMALLLALLGDVLPGAVSVGGVALGDAWHHRGLGAGALGVVPFHKLTQWLTYSLVEPLGEGGVAVDDLEELTGLAEYRNGGLFLDLGVLEMRDRRATDRVHLSGDELVVEWRALTVTLLDELAPRTRALLGDTASTMAPGTLEALTWAAGREAAYERRPHGAPPLHLELDGTLF